MKLFVRKISFYLILIIIIFGCNYAYNSYQIEHFEQLKGTKTIIVGDSRMMTGVDPHYLENSMNYAQNSESYFVSYFKLKFILKNSVGIKHIILGFSYPNFSAYQDGFYNNDIATADVLNRIYSIVKLSDFKELKVNASKFNMAYFRNMFLFPHSNHTPFLGNYTELTPSTEKLKVDNIIQRHYFSSDSTNIGISEINVKYLDSIRYFLKSRNVKLTLVNLPLPASYLNKIPKNFISKFDQVKEKLKSDKNCSVLDFGKENCPTNYFKDAVHLSNIGSKVYSKKINQILVQSVN